MTFIWTSLSLGSEQGKLNRLKVYNLRFQHLNGKDEKKKIKTMSLCFSGVRVVHLNKDRN